MDAIVTRASKFPTRAVLGITKYGPVSKDFLLCWVLFSVHSVKKLFFARTDFSWPRTNSGSDSRGDLPRELDNRFLSGIYHDLRVVHECYYVGGVDK